jgi:hypothetical protein
MIKIEFCKLRTCFIVLNKSSYFVQFYLLFVPKVHILLFCSVLGNWNSGNFVSWDFIQQNFGSRRQSSMQVKVKLWLRTPYCESRSTAALTLNLSTRWRWGFSFMAWQIYSRERTAIAHWIGGWVGPPSRPGLDVLKKRKFLTAAQNRTPDLPTCSLNTDGLRCLFLY